MGSVCKSHSFHVSKHQYHFKWNRANKPILTIDSGNEVSFDLKDGGNNQITDKSTIDAVINFDNDSADPAFGPIYVNGAEPGDVLRVDLLDLQPAHYGWTATLPGYGVLADELPEPHLKIWDLSAEHQKKGYAVFKKGIHVPIRPFLGVMGVAHAEEGDFDMIPPWAEGGNIDCQHITVGASLFLPVRVPGALFSCGDGHAAQGDGEVGGSAIETPMKARLRLTVEKNMPWVKSPQFVSNPETRFEGKVLEKGEYGCLGIDKDLYEACRKACRQAVEWLQGTKGLTQGEALMLLSVVGNLKIVEAVDVPHHAVSMSIPLSIFVEDETVESQ